MFFSGSVTTLYTLKWNSQGIEKLCEKVQRNSVPVHLSRVTLTYRKYAVVLFLKIIVCRYRSRKVTQEFYNFEIVIYLSYFFSPKHCTRDFSARSKQIHWIRKKRLWQNIQLFLLPNISSLFYLFFFS